MRLIMDRKVLRFTASWCQPCKMLAKTLESITTDYPIEVLYVKHIPKPIRFMLYPISQVMLGVIVLTSVTSVLFVSVLVNAYRKVKEAYNDYE